MCWWCIIDNFAAGGQGQGKDGKKRKNEAEEEAPKKKGRKKQEANSEYVAVVTLTAYKLQRTVQY